MKILPVLHSADILRNPIMDLPTVRDWSKVQSILRGTWPKPPPQHIPSTSARDFEVWWGCAQATAQYVVIDTEYDPANTFLTLVGVGTNDETVPIYQFIHRLAEHGERVEFGARLRHVTTSVPVVYHNAIADLTVLGKAYGITAENSYRVEDTMLLHALLWSDLPHDLGFLESLYSTRNKLKHLANTDPYLYNAGDVSTTRDAWEGLQREAESDPRTRAVYRDQSLPLINVVMKSQNRGIRVSQERVESATAETLRDIEWAEKTAVKYAGEGFNLGSAKQLQHRLYTVEGLPKQVNRSTKNPTVDDEAVAALRAHVGPYFDPDEPLTTEVAQSRIDQGAHPLLEARVLFAKARQTLSHYLNPMRGRDVIHPTFLVHAQASGRWSTVDPPLAQLPPSLRDLLVPFVGERWIAWDWDQIELRLLAALANDEPYLEAFRKGWDIHTLNTCAAFGWAPPPERTDPHGHPDNEEWRLEHRWQGKSDDRRTFTKTFIFRLNYGGEPGSAGDIPGVKRLGLNKKDLVDMAGAYLRSHPAIARYWNLVAHEGLRSRESRTFMGRRRRLLVWGKAAQKRILYNHPMQGGTSDIFNMTAIQVARQLPDATFVYGVCDAQTWAVPEETYDNARSTIQAILATPFHVGGRETVFTVAYK